MRSQWYLFQSCLKTYLFHGTDKIRHSFSIANNWQTNHEVLSDSSIKENAIKRAFKRYIDVHMSDNGHFRPFLDTFRIHLGKVELLLYLAVLSVLGSLFVAPILAEI